MLIKKKRRKKKQKFFLCLTEMLEGNKVIPLSKVNNNGVALSFIEYGKWR